MTTTGVLVLALLDCINPSAIVVTLYLLSTAGSRALAQVGVYVATIFVTYLLLGVMLMLGLGALLPSMGAALDGQPGFVLQSVIGLALVIYSARAGATPTPSPEVRPPSASTYAALVALGISVTVMELPTAVPYFAAIGLLSEAGWSMRAWAPVLALYNMIFVLPPVALLIGHLVLQDRLAQSYAALRQRLERGARDTMLWVAGLVGGALFVTGVIELVARL